MCRFCCILQHMCCWWSARVCESEKMWESEMQRWVRKRERWWESREGVQEKPRLTAVQQAAARGAAERRTGEEKKNPGRDWKKVRDRKMSNRAGEREQVRRRRRSRCLRGSHKWNSPRGSIWASAEIKAKRSKHGPKWLLWLTHWSVGKIPACLFLCEWSVNILCFFAELWELMRSPSQSLQSSLSLLGEKWCKEAQRIPEGGFWIIDAIWLDCTVKLGFAPVAQFFPPPGRFSVLLSQGAWLSTF